MWAEILSPSAIKDYEQCPKQYWYKKVSGATPHASGGWLVGSCFHDAMERYINQRYMRSFANCLQDIRLQKRWFRDEVSREALSIGEEWLSVNEMPIHTKLGAVEFPIAEMAFGPRDDRVHGTKVKKGNELNFENGLKVHGLIDMVYPEQNLDGSVTMVVVDWKTGRIPPKSIEFDRQAQVYAVAAHKLTQMPVRVEFHFVRYPTRAPIQWEPTEDDYPLLETELKVVQDRIKLEVEAEATPKLDCRYCAFNYDCKAFKLWTQQESDFSPMWEMMDLSMLAGEVDSVRSRMYALMRVNDEVTSILTERMDREQIDAIALSETHDYVLAPGRSKTEYSPEAQELIDLYGGVDMMSPKLRNEIEMYHKNKVPGNPFLKKMRAR